MIAADAILRHLRTAAGPATVAELVAATGLHENAVRRNLARLGADGMVLAERDPAAAGRGRPRLRYRAAGGPETPYRELMPLLLGLLNGAAPAPEEVFAAGLAHGRASAPEGTAREAATASLAAMGFAPADETPAGTPGEEGVIRLRTCPFADLVTRPGGRRLCALHHGILAGVAERRGAAVRHFEVVDPNRADCVLHLGADGGDGADQPPAGTAPSARAAARKASPRSS